MRRAGPTTLMCAALLLAMAPARAQWSASLALQSDQRFRGISLSDEKPQARASLAYDHPSGWYGGAMLGGMRFDERRRSALLLAYGGRVLPLARGVNGEAGATFSHFDGVAGYDYAELYAGLMGEGWSTRLYYAPDYFGRGLRSLYAELELNWPLVSKLHAFGHAGVLATVSGPGTDTRADLRAGIALRLDGCELQLAWVGVGRGGPYPAAYEQKRGTLVLSALWTF